VSDELLKPRKRLGRMRRGKKLGLIIPMEKVEENASKSKG